MAERKRVPAIPPMKEGQFSEWLRQAALTFGWLGYHTHRSQHSAAGFPDWCLVRRDRLIFAELKTDRKGHDPSEAQLEWMAALRAFGHTEVYLWRPADRTEIERVLA